MKVSLNLGDSKIWLGNKGLVFQVWDNNNKYKGKLHITKARVEWCKGKTPLGRGRVKGLNKFIAEDLDTM